MNFITLYADIDEGIFSKAVKPHDAIKGISLSEYSNSNLINTYYWKIAPSGSDKSSLPYLHEAWEEIEPIIFNKTVIMYDANFTVSTIIKTFEYLLNKTIPNTKPAQRYFPGLLKVLKSIRFDYMCLSLIYRRAFNNSPNKLSELCKAVNINFSNDIKKRSVILGDLLLYAADKTNCSSLMDMKHICGITLGQFTKNQSLKVNNSGEIIEYDKYYYPCVPITDDEIFRKYDFKQ